MKKSNDPSHPRRGFGTLSMLTFGLAAIVGDFPQAVVVCWMLLLGIQQSL